MDRVGALNLQQFGIWELLVLLQRIIEELQSRYSEEATYRHPPPPMPFQRRRVARGSCGEACWWCSQAPCTRGSANHSAHRCYDCRHRR